MAELHSPARLRTGLERLGCGFINMQGRIILYLLIPFAVVWLMAFILKPSHRERFPSVVRMEITNLEAALNQHRAEYGHFPTGTAVEIFKTLSGENPRKLVFFVANSRTVGSNGEFLDPWKTPYKIRMAETNYSIRSAGPNQVFGDKDDITNSTP